ncbi:mechanosensitive ion channel protein MscS [Sporosarcina sp. P37]|uniref:mechanosensitive ion channel family protein n=1 Tax=unclassified Sporosarcina TaxID=2647733 RepID=UPI0009BEF640|nr:MULTISPECIES: mechanosensitive ion channel family protein [unclassified Sporosarcina]ARD48383.1 mechanosensitive ion channel protein MscS [Sporosarcina sp. P33]ARK24886.1 mechanosensitive ion channel protein MscS [Sporosarcina sp. P37]PID20044.1 mechanosensitive ion channel family protein [Sporosarcina sp. P35]
MAVNTKEDVKENLKFIEELVQQMRDTLLDTRFWIDTGFFAIRIVLIVVVAGIVVKVGQMLIRRFFAIKLKSPMRKSERREKTIIKLLENALKYIVYFSAILAILTEFHIDAKGLLAGAGVLGLAVGFGAQSLVKDVISGFFIIFEDQFGVGDYVRINSGEGTVMEIGLRTTKIALYGGELYTVPNGQIGEVINFSVTNSMVLLDLALSYETDIDHAEELIKDFLKKLPKDRYAEVIGIPEVLGVQSMEPSRILLRIAAETEPVANFGVGRKLRQDLKKFMDQNGIEMPYPRMVIHKENMEGNSYDGGERV